MRVLPANLLKSTMTSARSAGPRKRPWVATLPTVTLFGLVSKSVGVGGITTGAGRRPPSVPIWIHAGPAKSGFGTTPVKPAEVIPVVVGQVVGQQLDGRPV